MRVPAGAVGHAGGPIRITRYTYESLPPGHAMSVEREPLTGDLVVRARMPADVATEMTFNELRAKYNREATAADAPRAADGHPDGGPVEVQEGAGEASPEPQHPALGVRER